MFFTLFDSRSYLAITLQMLIALFYSRQVITVNPCSLRSRLDGIALWEQRLSGLLVCDITLVEIQIQLLLCCCFASGLSTPLGCKTPPLQPHCSINSLLSHPNYFGGLWKGGGATHCCDWPGHHWKRQTKAHLWQNHAKSQCFSRSCWHNCVHAAVCVAWQRQCLVKTLQNRSTDTSDQEWLHYFLNYNKNISPSTNFL